MPFAHIAMAVEGCGWTHPDYFALMVANVVSRCMLIDCLVMNPVPGHEDGEKLKNVFFSWLETGIDHSVGHIMSQVN